MRRPPLTTAEKKTLRQRVRRGATVAELADDYKISPSTVYKQTETVREKLGLRNEKRPLFLLMRRIYEGPLDELSEELGMNRHVLRNFLDLPEHYSVDRAKTEIIPKLMDRFPDKSPLIRTLETITCDFRALSAHSVLKPSKKDFREATGIMLREFREAAGLTTEGARARIKNSLIHRNLLRIEVPDLRLATTIYRAAIEVLMPIYAAEKPERENDYVAFLKLFAMSLKP